MADRKKDPYETLGVAKSVAQEEIRKAYRNLAKKYHPDLNPGNAEAERRFKEINEAYERIGTAESRAKQDRGEFDQDPSAAGAHGARPGEDGPFYYYQTQGGDGFQGGRYSSRFGEDFEDDPFAAFFGRGGRAQAKPRAEDELYRMEIDLKDSVLGAEREIGLPSGKRLAVKIPPGVGDGTRLRFAGQAGSARGGIEPGDVYVEIQVRPDERFRRDGDRFVYELPLSLADAVLGAEVRVPTVEGEVLLKVPAGSSTGDKLRVAGKGAYDRKTKKRGDEIVVLRVTIPRNDPELKAFVQKWSRRGSGESRPAG